MKKFKLIVFICLIFSLFLLLFCSIFGTNLSFKNLDKIKENRKNKEIFKDNIKINGIDLLYDKNSNVYYYMISEKYENQKYMFKLDLDTKYKYKIIDYTLNIIDIKYDEPIKVIIYDKKNYYKINIQLTNLPLINIETDNEITSENQNTIFTYINENSVQRRFENDAKIKVRGATTQVLDKKSYRVNFYNKSYTEEKKVSFSKFYTGDSLILDGVYRDASKIRNLLATELWNDISKDFTELRMYSEFVEVFINDEYRGLYLLTEPINRTKLKLNKTNNSDSSFVVKSTLGILDVKYPNDETYTTDTINVTKSIILKYLQTRMDASFEIIEKTFDINNYVDIIIFNYFINNLDNRLDQNVYYYNDSLKENIVYIQPWDMEWTFGLIPAQKDEDIGIKSDSNIFDCLLYHPNSPEINKLIIERYWELRKNILTEEYFNNLINNYSNQLIKGSAFRDSNTWYEYDIQNELDFIKTWIKDRIKYTDEKIKEIKNEL